MELTPIDDSAPLGDAEMALEVAFLREEIATQLSVQVTELSSPLTAWVIDDDLKLGYEPTPIPISLPNSGLLFSSASLPDTTAPTVTGFSPCRRHHEYSGR